MKVKERNKIMLLAGLMTLALLVSKIPADATGAQTQVWTSPQVIITDTLTG